MLKVRSFLLPLAIFVPPALSGQTPEARYLRIEAPASERMAILEIAAFENGENLLQGNGGSLAFSGTGYQGREVTFRDDHLQMIDGKADPDSRGFGARTDGILNPWIEIDVGAERVIDRVALTQPAKLQYADRGLRLVSLLDAERRIVFVRAFDIRESAHADGVADFDVEPADHALAKRRIPENTAGWAPVAALVPVEENATPPDADERAARFANRNSPARIEALAREFCARLDLSKPDLKPVRDRLAAGDFSGALDAYRDHFLRKIQTIAFLHFHPPKDLPDAAGDAEGLMATISVTYGKDAVAARRIEPGAIDWAHLPKLQNSPDEAAKTMALFGSLQRPLLRKYAETGEPAFLQSWADISADWGMNIRADLDRAAFPIRDYFVKNELQHFNHIISEVAEAVRARPEMAQQLPGADLARFLMPALVEYPPAYWWVCRRATFNHTYNALIAATVTSRILDDFHAGQRLDRENRQHWERVWTAAMTRDGSMNEVGDEGHLTMPWRMGVAFRAMEKNPPPWFSADFAAEFTTGWETLVTMNLRHTGPGGSGHRKAVVPRFESVWQMAEPVCTIGGMIPAETVDSRPILRRPEVERIVRTVFGGEHPEVGEFYGGGERSAPRTASDWLPYAGLWYLRSSWKKDAAFVAMIQQPIGHPETNGQTWNTEFQVWDDGQPLVRIGPVEIDGLPQCDTSGRPVFAPGSKTMVLSAPSETPIPLRWHTSEHFDYAESEYEGVYQRRGHNFAKGQLELGDKQVRARAERRIVLLRDSGLVIATDFVKTEGGEPHEFRFHQRFGAPGLDKRNKVGLPGGEVSGKGASLTLTHPQGVGATVWRFTEAELNWDAGKQPSWWDDSGRIGASGGGNLLMATLIDGGEPSVKSVSEIVADGVAGFRAELTNGGELTWLSTGDSPRELSAGPVTANAESLLVSGNRGLVLGAVGHDVADFEFVWENGEFARITPIHRPIEPVTFSPDRAVFSGEETVTMHSATPGVEIRYTTDGSDPTPESPLYTAPIVIAESAFIRARAFRPGVTELPFTMDGTRATVISEARFTKRDPLPATDVSGVEPGLNWEIVESADWRDLFSHLHLPDVLSATRGGVGETLLDVSMRRTAGAVGLRQTGYLRIPADGVWTFHAPPEFAIGTPLGEPGYDLRLWIDGEEWDLGQRFHARDRWSIPLKAGLHQIVVTFADARQLPDRSVPDSGLWRGYPTPWVVWKGTTPELEISGPGFERAPVPDRWLFR